ncbi:MAG: glycosyltransferase family 4 protein, partial [Tissierellales bacterium]|nr:glycosyltransferase family 4 protein [Tissierellales bacterium]
TPFGIDIQKFTKNEKIRNDDKIVIGIIKTLSPKYGIDDFIKAISILREKLINEGKPEVALKIQGKIYGDGEQKLELEQMISKLELDNIVSLEGKIPYNQVPSVLNEFDIFCATSISESFGVAVVEAMATELPVVATDALGFKEVVDDGITGLIARRKSPQEIACALKKLILDKSLRESMGIHGRKKVIELYNWDDNVSTMEQIYHQAVSDESFVN